jgi:hypothetical protein
MINHSSGTWTKTQKEQREAAKSNKKREEEERKRGKELLKQAVLIPVGVSKNKKS